MTKYLLDANIFIESHNLHYHPCFCQGFWEWIVQGHNKGIFFSLDKVEDELVRPPSANDELSDSLRTGLFPNTFFIQSLSDTQTARAYGRLMQWVSNHRLYNLAAIKEFQLHTAADAFLVAAAMAHGYIIVTQEVSGNSPKRVKIPDAARENGVRCITIQQLLRMHAEDNFKLK